MKQITSASNPLFKSLKKLAHSARVRKKQGEALLDGIHLLAAALDAGCIPLMTILAEGRAQHPEIVALLARLPAATPVIVLPAPLFAELTELETPAGILAQIAIPAFSPETPGDACALLEDIQDPGNLGSILRSAAAAGVDSVYLSAACADAWSPRVLRAAMGAHFAVRIHEQADLVALAGRLPHQVVATCLGASDSLFDVALSGQVAFVLGNEGAGISPGLGATAGRQVYIPMPGAMESLNVAAAAAVCFFERVRQLRARPAR